MSRRPWEARPQPGRGGDGWRRRWSESPIPRAATRRVRMAGAPPPLYSNGYSHTVPQTRSAPPATVYMDQYNWTGTPSLAQGGAMLDLMVGYQTGGWTLPTGWTSVASGTVGALEYEVAWCSHLTSPSGILTLPSWSAGNSFLAIYTIGPLTAGRDFPYELAATSVTTAANASSQVMADPTPGWVAPFSVTFMMRDAKSGWPFYSVDTDVNGVTSSDETGTPVYFGVVFPTDPDVEHSLMPGNGATVSLLGSGANGDFATLGLGWVPA